MNVLLSAADTFVVTPDVGLLMWTAIAVVSVPAGVVAALKGRWGCLLLGLFLGGLPWLVGAFLAPRPASMWIRWSAKRERASTVTTDS